MRKQDQKPPLFLSFLLSRFENFSDEFNLLGDIDEEFMELQKSQGRRFALSWYRKHFMKLFPALVSNSIKWEFVMFKNYLKIAIRNLYKNKSISFINIFGLTFGMACAILIFMWVQNQLSYNQWQKNKDNIYRLETNDWVVLPPYQAEIPRVFAEVKETVRFYFW